MPELDPDWLAGRAKEATTLGYEEVRQQILDKYGGRCQTCRDTDSTNLMIMPNTGVTWIELAGDRRPSGTWGKYVWIYSHAFPPRFHIVCRKCNRPYGNLAALRSQVFEGYGNRCIGCQQQTGLAVRPAPEYTWASALDLDSPRLARRYQRIIELEFPNSIQLTCSNACLRATQIRMALEEILGARGATTSRILSVILGLDERTVRVSCQYSVRRGVLTQVGPDEWALPEKNDVR